MIEPGRALRAAAVLGAVEAAALITVVVWNGGRAAALVVTMLAVKFPFCLGVARRWVAAWFGLLLWELAGMLAAVTAPGTPSPCDCWSWPSPPPSWACSPAAHPCSPT